MSVTGHAFTLSGPSKRAVKVTSCCLHRLADLPAQVEDMVKVEFSFNPPLTLTDDEGGDDTANFTKEHELRILGLRRDDDDPWSNPAVNAIASIPERVCVGAAAGKPPRHGCAVCAGHRREHLVDVCESILHATFEPR